VARRPAVGPPRGGGLRRGRASGGRAGRVPHLRRGLERDGADARDHWLRWMADEAAHYEREDTRVRADVRLDGLGKLTP
jgi:hypothetical protein